MALSRESVVPAFPPASPRRGAPVIRDRRNAPRAAELDSGLAQIPAGLALAGVPTSPQFPSPRFGWRNWTRPAKSQSAADRDRVKLQWQGPR
jgi:hypothetical protein